MDEETEGFSSNESGWTKYIGSPGPEHNSSSYVDDGDDHGNDDDDCAYCKRDHDHDRDRDRDRDRDHGNDDDDDRDSIVSDASSGPPAPFMQLPSEVGTCEGGNADKHIAAYEVDYFCNLYSSASKKLGCSYKEVKGSNNDEKKVIMTNNNNNNNEIESIQKPNSASSYNVLNKLVQGKKKKNKQGDK
ncbi:hypothetical protein Dimus_031207 [Dionaea muscipula]